MITDSFFHQGVTHEVCEDYAIHGDRYAIVSDGCSNGGGPSLNSDWGARLLCKSAQGLLERGLEKPDGWDFFLRCGTLAQAQVGTIPCLSADCLTATLGVCYVSNNCLVTALVGDGVVGGRRKRDGNWKVYNYEFLPGGSSGNAAPFYLKYELEHQTQQYLDLFGGAYRLTCYESDSGEWRQVTQWEGLIGGSPPISRSMLVFRDLFDMETHDAAFVATDGLSSFYKQVNTGTSKFNEPVPLADVLGVILDVKPRPGFLRLQRQWAFKRNVAGTFLRREWHNADDVSVAAVCAGDV